MNKIAGTLNNESKAKDQKKTVRSNVPDLKKQ